MPADDLKALLDDPRLQNARRRSHEMEQQPSSTTKIDNVRVPDLLRFTLFTVHALSGFLFYTGDIGTTKSKVGGVPACDGREALLRRGWSSIIFQLYW